MQVYVDGEILPLGPDAGSTLGEALEAVRAGLEGRLVIEALADGEPIPSAHFDEPPPTDPYADRLEIRTEDAGALVRFSFLEAAEALERIRDAQGRAAELLQTGDTVASMDEMKSILETWSAAAQTVTIAQQLEEITLPAATDGGRTIDDVASTLHEMLQEVRRCLAGDDPSGLADVLAYDMHGAADEWVAMLRHLAGSLGAERAG